MAAKEEIPSNQAELPVINPVADYEKIRRIGEVISLNEHALTRHYFASLSQSLLDYFTRFYYNWFAFEQLHLHCITINDPPNSSD